MPVRLTVNYEDTEEELELHEPDEWLNTLEEYFNKKFPGWTSVVVVIVRPSE